MLAGFPLVKQYHNEDISVRAKTGRKKNSTIVMEHGIKSPSLFILFIVLISSVGDPGPGPGTCEKSASRGSNRKCSNSLSFENLFGSGRIGSWFAPGRRIP